jgi:tripartite-type tricarboxylate transporter receptor subunit TctC
MRRCSSWMAAFAVGTWWCVAAHSAAAQSPAEFYSGRTLTIVVSSAAGGGYDTMSRSVARHLPRHLAGAPSVIVQNMPGAGGIVATNHIYSIAAKDGSVIGQLQTNTAFEPLMGTKAAAYDPQKLNWLGTPAFETGVLTVWHGAGVKTLEDARKRELTAGVPGVNSTPALYTRLVRDTLGLKIRLVAGYTSQTDSQMAMEKGETDAFANFYSTVMAFRPTFVAEGKLIILVQYGAEREPTLSHVPFAPDLVTNADDKAMMQLALAPLAMGRPFVAPPGIPADRLAALRTAFNAVFADKEFVADVEKTGFKVNRPRSGEELHATIGDAYKAPKPIVDRLRALQER